jgi:hypothetical protein
MSFYKKQRLLLLGFIVIGMLLSSFHHHGNGLVSDDCKICVVQHNLDSAGSVESYTLEELNTKIDISTDYENGVHNARLNFNFLSRAPPSFS